MRSSGVLTKKPAVRIRRASFRNQKTLEDFDFSFNPKLNRALILDLATIIAGNLDFPE